MSLFKGRKEKESGRDDVQKARDKVHLALAEMDKKLKAVSDQTELALKELGSAGR